MTVRILIGDCRERLRELPDQSAHCCVTSPPYFGLRDYGVDGQMGLEPTPDEFVAGMVEVFREVRRVLRDDGTLWLNIGDSYCAPNMEAMPVAELAAPDSVLFLWVVQTQIPQAVRLVEAWGFELKSVAFAWMKGDALPFFPEDVACQMGMGKWTRAEFEQCWLATRGKPKRLNADVRQVLVEKRREHSRKPDSIHHRIERLIDGPRLELFARTPRAGWTVWGNETDKFAQVAA